MPESRDPVPKPPAGPRRPARDGILVVLLAVVLLVLFEGPSIRHSGQDMQPGVERDALRAVGAPAGWVADRLPFDEASDEALAVLEDDAETGAGTFGRARGAGGVPPVPPESFDPAALGDPSRTAAAARDAARDGRLAVDAARRRAHPPARRPRASR